MWVDYAISESPLKILYEHLEQLRQLRQLSRVSRKNE
jgi:hypothetical protein